MGVEGHTGAGRGNGGAVGGRSAGGGGNGNGGAHRAPRGGTGEREGTRWEDARQGERRNAAVGGAGLTRKGDAPPQAWRALPETAATPTRWDLGNCPAYQIKAELEVAGPGLGEIDRNWDARPGCSLCRGYSFTHFLSVAPHSTLPGFT